MPRPETYVLPNRLRDPYEFELLLEEWQQKGEGADALDCSRVSFIEPYSMIALLLAGRNHLRKTGSKMKLVNVPISIHQYLHRMDFFKAGIFETAEKLSEDLLLRRSALSNRVIEITGIPNKERENRRVIEDIVRLFRRRAKYILSHWLTSDRIVDYFVTVISEICQNIYEHSLDSGYLAMQTYRTGKENIVRLAVSDSGIGIEQSFEKRSVKYDSPAHLIELAMTTPLSSKRDFGYGLCQVHAIMERIGGSIYIRSGNASVSTMYHAKSTGKPRHFLKDDLPFFNGTQISISLTG